MYKGLKSIFRHKHRFYVIPETMEVSEMSENSWYGTYTYTVRCRCGAEHIRKERSLI